MGAREEDEGRRIQLRNSVKDHLGNRLWGAESPPLSLHSAKCVVTWNPGTRNLVQPGKPPGNGYPAAAPVQSSMFFNIAVRNSSAEALLEIAY